MLRQFLDNCLLGLLMPKTSSAAKKTAWNLPSKTLPNNTGGKNQKQPYWFLKATFLLPVFLCVCLAGVTVRYHQTRSSLKVFQKAQAQEAAILQRCEELFDRDYYLKKYPEIQSHWQENHCNTFDPFQHYMLIGYKEGRSPFPGFDAKFYEKTYQSSLYYGGLSGGNESHPLKHYVSVLEAHQAPLNPGQIKPVTLLKNPKHYVAACAIFQNEARFLKEWIEFHRMLGVQHFYLCNHNSTDNFQKVLAPYIQKGLVTLTHERKKPKNPTDWRFNIQGAHYERTAKAHAHDTEWMLFIDVDEYLAPLQDKDIPSLLKRFDQYAGVLTTWVWHGTSNVEKIAPSKTMCESLTLRIPQPHSHTKTIAKPRYLAKNNGPHLFFFKPGHMAVTEEKRYACWAVLPVPRKESRLMRLTHYWLRDNTFLKEKIKRMHKSFSAQGSAGAISLINHHNGQAILPDHTMLRFVPELRRRMGFDAPTALPKPSIPAPKTTLPTSLEKTAL